MPIDLHTHSTASDGTCTPAELVRAAADAGLTTVGLTDHDTVAGWASAVEALPAGLTLVPGAELSCRWHGPGRPIGLHLLAYLFDPAHPELVAALERVRRSRDSRAERMVALLRADGIDVTWEEILHYANGGSIGRPHLAQALMRRGLVGSVSEAFGERWLGAKYRLPKEDLDVFEAVRLVRAAGGVSVFAHPRASVRGRVVPDDMIVDLAKAGLHGLEVDHDDHSPAEREDMRALATELDLIMTGSSDFHGTNKTVRLAANTTAPDQLERLLATASHGKPFTQGDKLS
ncbi:phosphatase [Virgisporangium aliadipatigenens]|uniref:Phosphatase n=1 Tax=Virgisporangium aliadipatigenens TaxID=741659 RepID=A0A8J4DSU1_9ACTN|nr:PHP domain-containing protein [Virgisporangium aliadipatigenens]GIJ48506.1 phosphatase [Virgisporangium aliadipatigenens]